MNVSPSIDFRECGSASAKALAAKLAALSHPARIEILKHLSGKRACCCKDVVQQLDLAQSTVSQHLKVLVEAGLVRFSAERQRSRYEIDREALADMSASVATLVDTCCSGR
jgi:ArsR family transcriptional regulator, arsenate/arsenite/antimonite-responsive transcriptional repressor